MYYILHELLITCVDKRASSSTNPLPLPKKQKTIKDIVLNPSDNHISRRCKLPSLLKNDYKEYRVRLKPKIISILLLWIVLSNCIFIHSKYFDKYQKSSQS
jgi:hypothetical protein